MVDQLPTSTGAGDLPSTVYEWPKITWVSLGLLCREPTSHIPGKYGETHRLKSEFSYVVFRRRVFQEVELMNNYPSRIHGTDTPLKTNMTLANLDFQ